MRIWSTILLLFSFSAVFGQSYLIDLPVRKNLRDKMDDLVFQFQILSRLNDPVTRNQYRRLFSEDAEIYDFISPNYNSNGLAKEMVKPIDQFISDLSIQFPNGFDQFNITETNLGEEINYSSFSLSDGVIMLDIAFKISGEYYQGGQFYNEPAVRLIINFEFEENKVKNLKIAQISKISSVLSYQRKERIPVFEKQFNAGAFNSWNQYTANLIGNAKSGTYYYENLRFFQDRGFQGSVELIRLMAAPEPEEFAWSIGFGYNQNNFKLGLDYFNHSITTKDEEGEDYYRNSTGNTVTENVSLHMIDVPVKFRYERQFSKKLSFFIHPGLSLSYQFGLQYSGNGVFSYSRFYPKGNLDLDKVDIPELGIYFNKSQSDSKFLSTSFLAGSGLLSLGLTSDLTPGIQLYVGAMGYKNVFAIKQKENTNELVPLSTADGVYNGLFRTINSVNAGAYGIQIGIRKRFVSKSGRVKYQ